MNQADAAVPGERVTLSEDERAAMRAYLQRAEVRLSTMHRIAGVFLNGAGLLFLLPVFLRDAFVRIAKSALTFGDPLLQVLATALLFAVLGIPLWALYLLIKDIINFYFTAYHAGLRERFFHPRLVLSGIAFSDDEARPEVKDAIIASQQTRDMLSFIVPQDQEDRKTYLRILSATQNQIIPERRLKYMPSERDELNEDVRLFDAALGLAGVVDRSLIEEVAKMEMSLARHAISLRHLVLRYSKALLLFLLTTVILVVSAELLAPSTNGTQPIPGGTGGQFPQTDEVGLLLLYATFVLWAFLTPLLVTRPISWIYRFAAKNLTRINSDHQLLVFERTVMVVSIVAFAVASCLTAMATATLFGWKQQYAIALALFVSIGFGWFWLWYSFVKHREIHSFREASPESTPEHAVRSGSAGEGIGVEQSTHISQEGTGFDSSDINLAALHRKISETFSDSELGTLCRDVGVDYDDLEGFGRAAKAKDLVFYLERRGRIPQLLAQLQQERPHVDWQRFVRQQP